VAKTGRKTAHQERDYAKDLAVLWGMSFKVLKSSLASPNVRESKKIEIALAMSNKALPRENTNGDNGVPMETIIIELLKKATEKGSGIESARITRGPSATLKKYMASGSQDILPG